MNDNFLPITAEQANAPKPTKPEPYQPLYLWEYYFIDLACWKATQAERYLSGIKE